MSRTRYGLFLCWSVALSLPACSRQDHWKAGRPPVYRATGIVTLEGAPVAGANVNLLPLGEGPAAYGLTDAQGQFKLSTYDQDDGAAAGSYQVTVSKKEVETRPDANPELNPPVVVKVTYLVPEKYEKPAENGLAVDVRPDQPNKFAFDLRK